VERDDEIWELIDRVNDAWLGGRPSETAELFATDSQLVAPGLSTVITGRDAIVQTYIDTVAAITTDRFEVTDRMLSITDDTAVATYSYEISYRMGDSQHDERGQEILVLCRTDHTWKAIWRTQIPLT